MRRQRRWGPAAHTRLSRSRPRRRGETGRGTASLQGKAASAAGCRARAGGAGLSPSGPSALDAFISITRTQSPPSRSPGPWRSGLCRPAFPAWCRAAMAAAATRWAATACYGGRWALCRHLAVSSAGGWEGQRVGSLCDSRRFGWCQQRDFGCGHRELSGRGYWRRRSAPPAQRAWAHATACGGVAL